MSKTLSLFIMFQTKKDKYRDISHKYLERN